TAAQSATLHPSVEESTDPLAQYHPRAGSSTRTQSKPQPFGNALRKHLPGTPPPRVPRPGGKLAGIAPGKPLPRAAPLGIPPPERQRAPRTSQKYLPRAVSLERAPLKRKLLRRSP